MPPLDSLALLFSAYMENFDLHSFLQDMTPFISGIFSFVGGYIAAKKSAKTQILTTAQTSFVSAKLKSFQEFEDAFENWCVHKDRTACAKMYHYGNAVLLVANQETSTCALQLLELIRAFETSGQGPDFDEISSVHTALIMAMKSDLLTFPVPKAQKTEGRTKRRGKKSP